MSAESSDQYGDSVSATQRAGHEDAAGLQPGGTVSDESDDISTTGAIDPDQPSGVNSAAGFSIGGTGTGIEPGTSADYTVTAQGPGETLTADVYGESRADLDFDPDSDELGMGQDEV